jgi:hypothetical protein
VCANTGADLALRPIKPPPNRNLQPKGCIDPYLVVQMMRCENGSARILDRPGVEGRISARPRSRLHRHLRDMAGRGCIVGARYACGADATLRLLKTVVVAANRTVIILCF